MFAIVDIAGFQEKAEKGLKLRVPRLEAKEGDTVTFDKVLLLSMDDASTTVGKPFISGVTVKAKVVFHGRGDKIVVTKFKRRKRFHKTYRGHRQDYTDIEIIEVGK
jgi:large subunit ribosomal protein L21